MSKVIALGKVSKDTRFLWVRTSPLQTPDGFSIVKANQLRMCTNDPSPEAQTCNIPN
jgi:hypothetical protein